MKQVRQFADSFDYIVVSLNSGGTNGAKSSGLHQYYRNPQALHKLLSHLSKARTNEVGKLAAFDYEAATLDD